MTLVEVMASLALLATLLAGLMLARGRISHQCRRADRRNMAVEATEQFLSERWPQLPAPAEGTLAGHLRLHWRTTQVRTIDTQGLRGRVVKLEMLGVDERAVLCAVEVVLPEGPRAQ